MGLLNFISSQPAEAHDSKTPAETFVEWILELFSSMIGNETALTTGIVIGKGFVGIILPIIVQVLKGFHRTGIWRVTQGRTLSLINYVLGYSLDYCLAPSPGFRTIGPDLPVSSHDEGIRTDVRNGSQGGQDISLA